MLLLILSVLGTCAAIVGSDGQNPTEGIECYQTTRLGQEQKVKSSTFTYLKNIIMLGDKPSTAKKLVQGFKKQFNKINNRDESAEIPSGSPIEAYGCKSCASAQLANDIVYYCSFENKNEGHCGIDYRTWITCCDTVDTEPCGKKPRETKYRCFNGDLPNAINEVTMEEWKNAMETVATEETEEMFRDAQHYPDLYYHYDLTEEDKKFKLLCSMCMTMHTEAHGSVPLCGSVYSQEKFCDTHKQFTCCNYNECNNVKQTPTDPASIEGIECYQTTRLGQEQKVKSSTFTNLKNIIMLGDKPSTAKKLVQGFKKQFNKINNRDESAEIPSGSPIEAYGCKSCASAQLANDIVYYCSFENKNEGHCGIDYRTWITCCDTVDTEPCGKKPRETKYRCFNGDLPNAINEVTMEEWKNAMETVATEETEEMFRDVQHYPDLYYHYDLTEEDKKFKLLCSMCMTMHTEAHGSVPLCGSVYSQEKFCDTHKQFTCCNYNECNNVKQTPTDPASIEGIECYQTTRLGQEQKVKSSTFTNLKNIIMLGDKPSIAKKLVQGFKKQFNKINNRDESAEIPSGSPIEAYGCKSCASAQLANDIVYYCSFENKNEGHCGIDYRTWITCCDTVDTEPCGKKPRETKYRCFNGDLPNAINEVTMEEWKNAMETVATEETEEMFRDVQHYPDLYYHYDLTEEDKKFKLLCSMCMTMHTEAHGSVPLCGSVYSQEKFCDTHKQFTCCNYNECNNVRQTPTDPASIEGIECYQTTRLGQEQKVKSSTFTNLKNIIMLGDKPSIAKKLVQGFKKQFNKINNRDESAEIPSGSPIEAYGCKSCASAQLANDIVYYCSFENKNEVHCGIDYRTWITCCDMVDTEPCGKKPRETKYRCFHGDLPNAINEVTMEEWKNAMETVATEETEEMFRDVQHYPDLYYHYDLTEEDKKFKLLCSMCMTMHTEAHGSVPLCGSVYSQEKFCDTHKQFTCCNYDECNNVKQTPTDPASIEGIECYQTTRLGQEQKVKSSTFTYLKNIIMLGDKPSTAKKLVQGFKKQFNKINNRDESAEIPSGSPIEAYGCKSCASAQLANDIVYYCSFENKNEGHCGIDYRTWITCCDTVDTEPCGKKPRETKYRCFNGDLPNAINEVTMEEWKNAMETVATEETEEMFRDAQHYPDLYYHYDLTEEDKKFKLLCSMCMTMHTEAHGSVPLCGSVYSQEKFCDTHKQFTCCNYNECNNVKQTPTDPASIEGIECYQTTRLGQEQKVKSSTFTNLKNIIMLGDKPSTAKKLVQGFKKQFNKINNRDESAEIPSGSPIEAYGCKSCASAQLANDIVYYCSFENKNEGHCGIDYRTWITCCDTVDTEPCGKKPRETKYRCFNGDLPNAINEVTMEEWKNAMETVATEETEEMFRDVQHYPDLYYHYDLTEEDKKFKLLCSMCMTMHTEAHGSVPLCGSVYSQEKFCDTHKQFTCCNYNECNNVKQTPTDPASIEGIECYQTTRLGQEQKVKSSTFTNLKNIIMLGDKPSIAKKLVQGFKKQFNKINNRDESAEIPSGSPIEAYGCKSCASAQLANDIVYYCSFENKNEGHCGIDYRTWITCCDTVDTEPCGKKPRETKYRCFNGDLPNAINEVTMEEWKNAMETVATEETEEMFRDVQHYPDLYYHYDLTEEDKKFKLLCSMCMTMHTEAHGSVPLCGSVYSQEKFCDTHKQFTCCNYNECNNVRQTPTDPASIEGIECYQTTRLGQEQKVKSSTFTNLKNIIMLGDKPSIAKKLVQGFKKQFNKINNRDESAEIPSGSPIEAYGCKSCASAQLANDIVYYCSFENKNEVHCGIDYRTWITCCDMVDTEPCGKKPRETKYRCFHGDLPNAINEVTMEEWKNAMETVATEETEEMFRDVQHYPDLYYHYDLTEEDKKFKLLCSMCMTMHTEAHGSVPLCGSVYSQEKFCDTHKQFTCCNYDECNNVKQTPTDPASIEGIECYQTTRLGQEQKVKSSTFTNLKNIIMLGDKPSIAKKLVQIFKKQFNKINNRDESAEIPSGSPIEAYGCKSCASAQLANDIVYYCSFENKNEGHCGIDYRTWITCCDTVDTEPCGKKPRETKYRCFHGDLPNAINEVTMEEWKNAMETVATEETEEMFRDVQHYPDLYYHYDLTEEDKKFKLLCSMCMTMHTEAHGSVPLCGSVYSQEKFCDTHKQFTCCNYDECNNVKQTPTDPASIEGIECYQTTRLGQEQKVKSSTFTNLKNIIMLGDKPSIAKKLVQIFKKQFNKINNRDESAEIPSGSPIEAYGCKSCASAQLANDIVYYCSFENKNEGHCGIDYRTWITCCDTVDTEPCGKKPRETKYRCFHGDLPNAINEVTMEEWKNAMETVATEETEEMFRDVQHYPDLYYHYDLTEEDKKFKLLCSMCMTMHTEAHGSVPLCGSVYSQEKFCDTHKQFTCCNYNECNNVKQTPTDPASIEGIECYQTTRLGQEQKVKSSTFTNLKNIIMLGDKPSTAKKLVQGFKKQFNKINNRDESAEIPSGSPIEAYGCKSCASAQLANDIVYYCSFENKNEGHCGDYRTWITCCDTVDTEPCGKKPRETKYRCFNGDLPNAINEVTMEEWKNAMETVATEETDQMFQNIKDYNLYYYFDLTEEDKKFKLLCSICMTMHTEAHGSVPLCGSVYAKEAFCQNHEQFFTCCEEHECNNIGTVPDPTPTEGLECYENIPRMDNNKTVRSTTWSQLKKQIELFEMPSKCQEKGESIFKEDLKTEFEGNDLVQVKSDKKQLPCKSCLIYPLTNGKAQLCYFKTQPNSKLCKDGEDKHCCTESKCNALNPEFEPPLMQYNRHFTCYQGQTKSKVSQTTLADISTAIEPIVTEEWRSFFQDKMKSSEDSKFPLVCAVCVTMTTEKGSVPFCGYATSKQELCEHKGDNNPFKCCLKDGCNSKGGKSSSNLLFTLSLLVLSLSSNKDDYINSRIFVPIFLFIPISLFTPITLLPIPFFY